MICPHCLKETETPVLQVSAPTNISIPLSTTTYTTIYPRVNWITTVEPNRPDDPPLTAAVK